MKTLSSLSPEIVSTMIIEDQELSSNPGLAKHLACYAAFGRKFYEARSQEPSRNDRNHRLSDQVVKGFPYTSALYPWPVDDGGVYLQPLIQLDLSRASMLLSETLGEGLLQVWVDAAVRTIVQRIIPTGALLDELSSFFPADAGWLDPDRDDFLFPSDIVRSAQVEWVNSGTMFPAPELVLEQLSRGEADSLVDKLSRLGIRISSKNCENLQLGGYPWAIGNEARRVDYEIGGRRLLLSLRDGQGMFSLQVVYRPQELSLPSFDIHLIYM